MQQISLPFRVLLGAILVLGALWFTVLRPKDATTTSTAPGIPGLANGAAGAKSAVAKSDAASAAHNAAADAVDPDTTVKPADAASAATAAKPATSAAVKPAPGAFDKYVAGAGPAKSLVRALSAKKIVVMVFSNASADSDAVVQAAQAIKKRGAGNVKLRVTRIENVGKYSVFTANTLIAQAPSTLIIGPKSRARVIVGYTSTAEIAGAIAKLDPKLTLGNGWAAHRTRQAAGWASKHCGSGNKAAACRDYFANVNGTCATFESKIALSVDDSSSTRNYFTHIKNDFNTGATEIAGMRPPARFRASHRRVVANLKRQAGIFSALAVAMRGKSRSAQAAIYFKRRSGMLAQLKSQDAALRRIGYPACG